MEPAGEVKILMQSLTSHPELDEIVSPELVLVDPELAQLARRRLRVAVEWLPQTRAPAAAPPLSPKRPQIAVAALAADAPTAAPGTRRPTATSVVATAIPLLLLGAVTFAMVASEVQARFQDPIASVGPESVAPLRPERGSVAPTAWRTTGPLAPRPTTGVGGLDAVTLLPTTKQVEVQTLALLVNGSTAKPTALLDDRLGMLADNVWIECRQVDRSPQFDCRLGAGRSSSREWLLTVGITRNGMEVLTWGGRIRRANRGPVGSAL